MKMFLSVCVLGLVIGLSIRYQIWFIDSRIAAKGPLCEKTPELIKPVTMKAPEPSIASIIAKHDDTKKPDCSAQYREGYEHGRETCPADDRMGEEDEE